MVTGIAKVTRARAAESSPPNISRRCSVVATQKSSYRLLGAGGHRNSARCAFLRVRRLRSFAPAGLVRICNAVIGARRVGGEKLNGPSPSTSASTCEESRSKSRKLTRFSLSEGFTMAQISQPGRTPNDLQKDASAAALVNLGSNIAIASFFLIALSVSVATLAASWPDAT